MWNLNKLYFRIFSLRPLDVCMYMFQIFDRLFVAAVSYTTDFKSINYNRSLCGKSFFLTRFNPENTPNHVTRMGIYP